MGALADVIETHVGPWTIEEFTALGELPAWPRVELIEGSLVVSPHATVGHQLVCSKLVELLRPCWQRDMIVLSPANVAIPSQDSMPIPDVVVAHHRDDYGLAVPVEDAVLLVEVESPSTRRHDRLVKADLFARAGVPYYWRVELTKSDGEEMVGVHEYRLGVDTYVHVASWWGGQRAEIFAPLELSFDPADLTGRRR